MTQTRRLFLNVFASHGRALFVMACGLLTGRWALMALGEVDYGLLGLIGGLVIFISLINNVLSGAVARFYAYALGQDGAANGRSSSDECCRWFNLATLIHTIVPLVLIVVGYPIGEWAVRHWLTIPADRISSCVWVLRWTCLSAFIGMVTVPYRAMYSAKQYIAELTGYSVAQTIFHTCVLYYMVENPGDWLVWSAVWLGVQASSVNLIISIRSLFLFPECRYVVSYMFDRRRLCQLLSFSGWQFLGALGLVVREQGLAVQVNKFYGPAMNASYGIALTVSGQAQTFAREVNFAFAPAITTALGENDRTLFVSLVNRCSKFCAWLVLLLAIPLCVEIDEVMRLWLSKPPVFAADLCVYFCLALAIEQMSTGHRVATEASGHIRGLQILTVGSQLATLLGVALCFCMGLDVESIGIAYFVLNCVLSIGRVLFARKECHVAASTWLWQTVLPLFLVSFLGACSAYQTSFWMEPSFGRVLVSSVCFVLVFIPVSFGIVLTREERKFVVAKVALLKRKVASHV